MNRLMGVSQLCASMRSIVLRLLVCFAFLLAFLTLAKAQMPSQVVTWKASNSSAPLKHGDKITAQLRATIANGWHVYSISQPPGGPSPTIIGVPDGQSLSEAGTILGPLPREAFDPNFNMETEFYERSAAFKVPLEVTPTAKPGSGKIVIKVRFQTCNDRICLPPSTVEVPMAFRVATRSAQ
jgi:DsbC/DsbD-like thiol-disulfide interchange protein